MMDTISSQNDLNDSRKTCFEICKYSRTASAAVLYRRIRIVATDFCKAHVRSLLVALCRLLKIPLSQNSKNARLRLFLGILDLPSDCALLHSGGPAKESF